MAEGWKKWFWRSAGFGAGFATVLTMLIAGWAWYVSRPARPKPWSTKAIVAEYDYADTDGDKNNIVFYYTLINNTDVDYTIIDDNGAELAVKLERENSISKPYTGSDILKGDFPVFIPPHGRARFGIHIGYPYSEKYDRTASDDEKHNWGTRLAKYITDELGNVDGFEMFDSTERYEVVFSNGWKERAKEPIRLKSSEVEIRPAQPKRQ